MAHYATINQQNIVIAVNTGVDETVVQNGVGGSTEAWEAFYTTQLNNPTLSVKRTSYNNNYRKQYAGIGFTYDADADVFIALQPYSSWTLDTNYDWQPPTPMPSTGGPYRWSEEDLEWVAV